MVIRSPGARYAAWWDSVVFVCGGTCVRLTWRLFRLLWRIAGIVHLCVRGTVASRVFFNTFYISRVFCDVWTEDCLFRCERCIPARHRQRIKAVNRADCCVCSNVRAIKKPFISEKKNTGAARSCYKTCMADDFQSHGGVVLATASNDKWPISSDRVAISQSGHTLQFSRWKYVRSGRRSSRVGHSEYSMYRYAIWLYDLVTHLTTWPNAGLFMFHMLFLTPLRWRN